MSGFVEKGIIRVHNHVGPDIWLMQIELPRIAKEAKPGQFIHVKVNDPRYILRRPIPLPAPMQAGGSWKSSTALWEKGQKPCPI